MCAGKGVILQTYDEQLCRNIVATKYEHLLRKKYGNYVHLDFQHVYQWNTPFPDTPRLREVSGKIPCASFYYLKFLTDIDPDILYDIGCGMNFFKDIIPNIVGIDGVGNFDICDIFDKDFVAGHENFCQAAFTIDALHFCSILKFCDRVQDFSRLIKPKGRGYIAMNAARMLESTDNNTKQLLFGSISPENKIVADYFNTEIKKLNLEFLVIENLIEQKFDEYIDGNIRLIFQK
jgi:hypothetical protein